jgi:hypothetical protein
VVIKIGDLMSGLLAGRAAGFRRAGRRPDRMAKKKRQSLLFLFFDIQWGSG